MSDIAERLRAAQKAFRQLAFECKHSRAYERSNDLADALEEAQSALANFPDPIARIRALQERVGEMEQQRDELAAALKHIAHDPLTNDAEATVRQCFAECVRVARAALAKLEGKP